MVLKKIGEYATNILVNGSNEGSYNQSSDSTYDVSVSDQSMTFSMTQAGKFRFGDTHDEHSSAQTFYASHAQPPNNQMGVWDPEPDRIRIEFEVIEPGYTTLETFVPNDDYPSIQGNRINYWSSDYDDSDPSVDTGWIDVSTLGEIWIETNDITVVDWAMSLEWDGVQSGVSIGEVNKS